LTKKRAKMGNPQTDRRKEIGKRLESVRKARGLSQIDIAEACEVSRAAISQWEKGLTLAKMENLERAAERLSCSAEWLRSGDGAAPLLEAPPSGTRRAMRFTTSSDVGGWSKRPDMPPFSGGVPQIDNRGSMPAAKAEATALDWWRLPPSLLEDMGAQGAKLRFYRVETDSLAPAIPRHSHVLVDLAQRAPRQHHDDIFAINSGISIVFRRLRLDPKDEKSVSIEDSGERVLKMPLKKLKIVGRCIAYFRPL
jgi:transcriptional regulator with XRE-family HTH domain